MEVKDIFLLVILQFYLYLNVGYRGILEPKKCPIQTGKTL